MVRGKPFKKSLKRLVSAGAVARPPWLDVVEATRPPFQPVSVTKSLPIEYPEDRLRSVFMQRNPYARRIPVDMKAKSVSDRHLADRFVSIQLKLMGEKELTQEEAYNATNEILNSPSNDPVGFQSGDAYSSLSDQSVENEAARLYLASVRDSHKDQDLYYALSNQSKEKSGV